MEFTGDYYKCDDCGNYWDYNDFNCPECGSQNFNDISIGYEIEELESKLNDLKRMKAAHE